MKVHIGRTSGGKEIGPNMEIWGACRFKWGGGAGTEAEESEESSRGRGRGPD